MPNTWIGWPDLTTLTWIRYVVLIASMACEHRVVDEARADVGRSRRW